MSEHKKLYTSTPLLYMISFQPNKSNNLSPDLITFKGISHLRIILQDSGELCQVKQRGGLGARRRRNENRQERIEKKPIGQEEEDVKEEEDEKEIDNEHKNIIKKLEELRNKNKN